MLDGGPFDYEPSRERLLSPAGGNALPRGGDGTSLLLLGQRRPRLRGRAAGDGGAAARAQRTVTLLLAAAPTESEAATRLIELRREGGLTADRAARSLAGWRPSWPPTPCPICSIRPACPGNGRRQPRDNRRGQSALWSLGISGDDPLLLLEIHNAADASRAEPYMRLHRSLRLGGVTTELALAYREEPGYDTPLLDAIREAARSALCESLLGVRGGIHPVNLTIPHGEEALTLLTAVAAHDGARDLQRAAPPPADYRPLPILPVGRPERTPEDPLLSFPGGRFEQDGSFTVESPPLPACPGATCWPIPPSALWFPTPQRASPGQ